MSARITCSLQAGARIFDSCCPPFSNIKQSGGDSQSRSDVIKVQFDDFDQKVIQYQDMGEIEEPTETSNEESPQPNFARRALSIISIEPAIFLASLGYGLQSVISQV